jgi:hypothetical protein
MQQRTQQQQLPPSPPALASSCACSACDLAMATPGAWAAFAHNVQCILTSSWEPCLAVCLPVCLVCGPQLKQGTKAEDVPDDVIAQVAAVLRGSELLEVSESGYQVGVAGRCCNSNDGSSRNNSNSNSSSGMGCAGGHCSQLSSRGLSPAAPQGNHMHAPKTLHPLMPTGAPQDGAA